MEEENSLLQQDREIDLIELARKLWKEWRFILKFCLVGMILGLIIAFSIPKEYKTEVKLSPENAEINKTGQLGGLAAIAGINLNGATIGDALSPELYPDIVSSTPFLLELIDIPVETKNGSLKSSLYIYVSDNQKKAWWNYIPSLPFEIVGWTASFFQDQNLNEKGIIDPFRLTKEQEDYVKFLREKISVSVDKKTGVITASVILQDPLISAKIMEVVVLKLQEYITDYRTRKAKHDLAFSEKLLDDARLVYYKAQKEYATYVDANKNVISASFKTEEERLRNEMTLAYGVYNQMAQQLEMNKVKVQEVTPVYTVIEPPRIALKALKPNKPMILFVFILLSAVIGIGLLFMKKIDIFSNNK